MAENITKLGYFFMILFYFISCSLIKRFYLWKNIDKHIKPFESMGLMDYVYCLV